MSTGDLVKILLELMELWPSTSAINYILDKYLTDNNICISDLIRDLQVKSAFPDVTIIHQFSKSIYIIIL